MTRHADRKQAARALADAFAIPYTAALAALEAHTPPTDAEFDAADLQMENWDPLFYAARTGEIPASLMGGWGSSDWGGVFGLAVPDLAGGEAPGTEGTLGLSARPVAFLDEREPALAIEVTGVREGAERRVRGLWLAGMDSLLQDAGWRYGADNYLPQWRADLYPVLGEPEAAARVHVHDSAGGLVLFDGAVALPPTWLVAARVHPLGLQVVVGPISGTPMPGEFDTEEEVEEMFATGAMVGARIPVHITPVPLAPVPAENAS